MVDKEAYPEQNNSSHKHYADLSSKVCLWYVLIKILLAKSQVCSFTYEMTCRQKDTLFPIAQVTNFFAKHVTTKENIHVRDRFTECCLLAEKLRNIKMKQKCSSCLLYQKHNVYIIPIYGFTVQLHCLEHCNCFIRVIDRVSRLKGGESGTNFVVILLFPSPTLLLLFFLVSNLFYKVYHTACNCFIRVIDWLLLLGYFDCSWPRAGEACAHSGSAASLDWARMLSDSKSEQLICKIFYPNYKIQHSWQP